MPADPAVAQIRPYTTEDFDAVDALWRKAGNFRPWNDPAKDIALCLATPTSELFVAELDGAVVGTIMVGHDGHRGAVYYLAVQPEYQGFGLGRAMMGAVEAWLLNKGVWKLNLSVRAGNEDVLGFYDSLGYQRSATVLLERWIDPAKRGGS